MTLAGVLAAVAAYALQDLRSSLTTAVLGGVVLTVFRTAVMPMVLVTIPPGRPRAGISSVGQSHTEGRTGRARADRGAHKHTFLRGAARALITASVATDAAITAGQVI